MAFNKEKIQLFWIPVIGPTAPKAKTDIVVKDLKIIPGLRAGGNIAGLTSWTCEYCEYPRVSMDLSPKFRLFFASGNAPGSLASLLTWTDLSD